VSVRIRALEPGDAEAVLALRLRSFEGLRAERERVRWRWEFEANPFRDSAVPLAWVAEDEGVLIGHYGMLPCRVALDGAPRAALAGVDFCVDPDRRRLGLGLQLTRTFVGTAGRDVLLVTSPTPAAAELMRYCGAAILDADEEPCLWVLASGARVDESAAAPRGIRLEEIASFDARFDALASELSARWPLVLLRDARYLNWRYRDYPFARARTVAALKERGGLAGFAIALPDDALGRGYLCELCVPSADEAALDLLVADAARHARERGWGELYALHRDPVAARALERAGFVRVLGHGRRFVLHAPNARERLPGWYLTAGDGDTLFGVGE
jgi:hypothetical protein